MRSPKWQDNRRQKGKIDFWVFRDGSSRYSFSLYQRTIFVATVSFVLLFVFSLTVTTREIWARYNAPDEERSYLAFKEYLQKKQIDPQSTDAAADTLDGSSERKVKLIVDEYARIKRYEKQLEAKVSALNTMLSEVFESQSKYSDIAEVETKQDRKKVRHSSLRRNRVADKEELGIGGGDIVLSSKSLIQPSVTERLFKGDSQLSLQDMLSKGTERLAKIPLGAPVIGTPTSGFGYRRAIRGFGWQMHNGLDYAINQKTRVVATADGVVVHAGPNGAYGKLVVIDHGNGLETAYGHLAKIVVEVGKQVCRGQQIGYVGSTGRSTGPHVHYEVRVGGVPRDPLPFVQLAGLLRQLDS